MWAGVVSCGTVRLSAVRGSSRTCSAPGHCRRARAASWVAGRGNEGFDRARIKVVGPTTHSRGGPWASGRRQGSGELRGPPRGVAPPFIPAKTLQRLRLLLQGVLLFDVVRDGVGPPGGGHTLTPARSLFGDRSSKSRRRESLRRGPG